MPLLTTILLSIDSINLDASWSLHQDITVEPTPVLLDSIDRFGLLRPPIVKPHLDRYELICGARRLKALYRIQPGTTIGCSLLCDGAHPDDIMMVVAEDQLLDGPLSPIEAARYVALCTQKSKQQDQQELNRITGTTSTTQRKRLLSLLELEQPIRASIHDGEISEKTGRTLGKLPSSERQFLHHLFTRLSLNSNKQRRFLELMQIITTVERCTIADYMTENFADLCSGTSDNIPQQTSHLMQELNERAKPDYSQAKESFLRQVAEKKLPGNCRVTPSPAFENDQVTMEMDFSDFEAFSAAWDRIKKFL